MRKKYYFCIFLFYKNIVNKHNISLNIEKLYNKSYNKLRIYINDGMRSITIPSPHDVLILPLFSPPPLYYW
jgi:hypothetical protein